MSTGTTHSVWWRRLAVAAAAAALASDGRAAGLISLQSSNNIGVVGLIGAAVSNTGNSTAVEGVAYNGSSGATLTINSGRTVTGNLFEGNSGQITATNCGRSSGCIIDTSDLDTAVTGGGTLVNAATSDYTNASALTPTQSFTSITGATTIGDNGHNDDTNVISISSLSLTGSTANLTLNGTAADYFILKVAGNFSLASGASIILSGGLTANHVLFIFTGTGTQSVTIGSSTDTFQGSLLANNGHYTFTIDGTVHGAVINNGTITLNGANVVGSDAFAGVPEPGTWALLAFGLAGLALLFYYRPQWMPAAIRVRQS